MGRESNRRREGSGSVLILVGEEGPLQDQVLRSLVQENLPDEQQRCLNLEILDGREAGIDQILQRAATPPMLASRRLVVVRHADRLSIEDQRKLRDHLKGGLPPSLCFILLVEKISPDSPFYELQAGQGKSIRSAFRTGQENVQWVRRWIRGMDKEISNSALEALLEACGGDPNLLVGELEKIILGLEGRREIGIEDVLIQAGWKPPDLFALVQFLGEGKTRKAVEAIERLLEQGAEPPQIVGMIARHFRLLAKLKGWQREGRSQKEIQSRLRLPRDYFLCLQQQAQSFTWDLLEGAFERLLQVDLLIKSNETLGIGSLKRFVLTCGLSGPLPHDL